MTLIVDRPLTLNDLDDIEVPQDTDTYKALPHRVLVEKLTDTFSCKYGKDSITDVQFGVAKKGRQLFGTIEMKNKHNTDFSFSVGFRNSYDKSLSVGLIAGTRVFVCSNLCFSGDIKYMRKHTSGLDLDLAIDKLANGMSYKSAGFIEKVKSLKDLRLSLVNRKAKLYDLASNNIVPFSHLPLINKAIDNSKLFSNESGNYYGFYMAVTDYLKKYPLPTQIDRLQSLGTFMQL